MIDIAFDTSIGVSDNARFDASSEMHEWIAHRYPGQGSVMVLGKPGHNHCMVVARFDHRLPAIHFKSAWLGSI